MKKNLILVAAALATIPLLAGAATVAYTPGGTPDLNQGDTGIVGFNFTVTTPISVTSLGFLGVGLGGGDTPWSALYNVDTSSLLGSVNWAAGTAMSSAADGVGVWNYKPLDTPVTLVPGVTYQVVATAYWTTQFTDSTGYTYGTEISPIGFTTGGGFFAQGNWGTPPGTPTMSVSGLDSTPNVTSNFQYDVAPVPEPSTFVLIALGGVGFAMWRRRRILS